MIMALNGALSDLDTTTLQNATLVEKSAATAQALQHHARNLSRAAGRFKVSASDLVPV